jgi:hypothetical protein
MQLAADGRACGRLLESFFRKFPLYLVSQTWAAVKKGLQQTNDGDGCLHLESPASRACQAFCCDLLRGQANLTSCRKHKEVKNRAPGPVSVHIP